MKALSIRQPWATAIILGTKRIENRSWNTKFRGRFLVHAAKTIDNKAPDWVWDNIASMDMPLGGIIGSIELVDVVTESSSLWFTGPYGFVIERPIPMEFVPFKGRLGWFNYV